MARLFQWHRVLTGFSTLSTTTSSLAISSASLPDFTTITRVVGNVMFDYAPDRDPASTSAALMVFGLGTFSVPSAVDVANPDQLAVGWLYWRYQVVRAGFYGTYTDGLTPNMITVDFDVSGQRQIDSFSQTRLYIWAKTVNAIASPSVASLRVGLSVLYKLPEATP